MLLLLWLPLAIPIYLGLNRDPNLGSILAMAVLFIEFLFLWRFWGKYVHQKENIFASCGFSLSAANRREFVNGLAIGFWFCLSLFMLEAFLGWVKIITPSVTLIRVVAEGLLSGLGIGLAEELWFRGFILDELQQNYSKKTAMWVDAFLYAVLHFIKPIEEIIRTLVTFPALILLGLTLVLAKNRFGDRLGICIGIHGGLVWGYYIVNVAQLIEYTNKVPAWITGIDGNPTAGIIGLMFLTLLILGVARKG